MTLTRICCYCGKPFEVSPHASRRTYCFALDCINARRTAEREYKRAFDRAQRARAEGDGGEDAEADDSDSKRGPRRRVCLRCGKQFPSTGWHNRICVPCHDSEIWRRASSDHLPRYW